MRITVSVDSCQAKFDLNANNDFLGLQNKLPLVRVQIIDFASGRFILQYKFGKLLVLDAKTVNFKYYSFRLQLLLSL